MSQGLVEAIERLLPVDGRVPLLAAAAARARAAAAVGVPPRAAALPFAADALALLAASPDFSARTAGPFVGAVAGDDPVARRELLVCAVFSPAIAGCPPEARAAALLRLVVGVAPAAHARLVGWAGDLLAEAGTPRAGGASAGAEVRAGGVRLGRLEIERGDGVADGLERIAESAAGALGLALQAAAPDGAAGAILESPARVLRRLRLDLHDGPLQEVAWLRGDLALLAEQVAGAIDGPLASILRGRVQDVEARLVAIESSLREFAQSREPRVLVTVSLEEALAELLAVLDDRAGIRCGLACTGDADRLTVPVRVAAYRIVQEALTNAREHGHASRIDVRLDVVGSALSLEVVDNGAGFDPELERARALARGGLGLAGMAERAAQLGGDLWVESRRGGPTRVGATLPA